jgi:branched-chain amino acid transport system substrate-binding protein
MENSQRRLPPRQQRRRDFLVKTAGGVVAAGALSALPVRLRAAESINIGGLYPVTGSFAQIGQGCVNAAKLAVQMVNDAGGIKSLGGAKLNLIISDLQSDTTVTRTETDRLISGYKPAAIHGSFASALTLIASEVAERAKVPLLTGSSSDQLNKGRHYTFTPFSRASQFALAQLQMSKLVSDKPKVAVSSRTPHSAPRPPMGCASRRLERGSRLFCSSRIRQV